MLFRNDRSTSKASAQHSEPKHRPGYGGNRGGSGGIRHRSGDKCEPERPSMRMSTTTTDPNSEHTADQDHTGARPMISSMLQNIQNHPTRRMLQLICYHRQPFKAHWAFWVPSAPGSGIGTLIHVTGDVRDGFQFEIRRDYRLENTTRQYTVYNIGQMQSQDLQAGGRFEQVASSIPAPGGSLRSANMGYGAPRRRIEVRDCQWWVVQVVRALIQCHIIGEEEALNNLANIPQH